MSNDGKGEFVLSPNSKGQVLAYKRAYDDAGVDPASIDMVECHATGTPKGDKVELASMGTYFSQYNGKPIIGSVKSNLSHLLTAAGMPSMMKVMMSMKNGVIPATINVTEAVQAKDKYFGQEQIPSETIDWPHDHDVKRAGVSTFGFGGSNAHLVFQEAGAPIDELEPLATQRTPLAIVSVSGHFGSCDNVFAMQDVILKGETVFDELPPHRWRGIDRESKLLTDYGLSRGKAPKGAYIDSFDVDFMYFKIPPRKTDALIAQQMLMLKVADEAVHQAQLTPGSNVAVLVSMGVELEMHRYRGRVGLDMQITSALQAQGIELTSDEKDQLIDLCKQAMHDEVSINQYTSFIGNIMASRVSALWDFSGPSFTVSAEENSVYQCLDIAENLMNTSDVEAVVIAAVDLAGSAEHVMLRNQINPVSEDPHSMPGWFVGEGAGAFVVKSSDKTKGNDHVIATIDAFSLVTGDPEQALKQAIHEALTQSNCSPEDVEFVETNASGIAEFDAAEAGVLDAVYPNVNYRGSVKKAFGHCFSASGMASIIKVLLCMNAGRLPVNASVTNSAGMSHSSNSVWPDGQRAAINSIGSDGRSVHLILSRKGPIISTPREAPKRQLIRQVWLGDEAIQDKIYNADSVAQFAELKQSNLSRGLPMKETSNQNGGMQQAALGEYVSLDQLITGSVSSHSQIQAGSVLEPLPLALDYHQSGETIWDEKDLLEFAEGDIANVFGPDFAIIDTYSRRVRLPMEDYLLVSRVTALEATPNVYEPCMMTTEYDVPLDAPYLVDGMISWAVAVESGQCDLMLISYLGIDFQNKGDLVYRLLDCQLTFIDDLAFGGQTLRYEIHIDSFAKQGDTLLFFFHYDCFIKDKKVLEMRGGCAGFFTDEALAAGKGVVRTKRELLAREQILKQRFEPIIQCDKQVFTRSDIKQLIQGDLVGCYGSQYEQGPLNPSLRFSSEKFLMHDHIHVANVYGGAWGLGMVESYKLLEPDHWYFPCHFKDDQVMAGSLMADGCGQLLMFYMMYLGLHTKVENGRFHPMQGEKQTVRCRGQVTPQSGKLHYRLEVTDIGVDDRVYMKANVEIVLNDKVVVDFENMCVEIKEQNPSHPYARDIDGSGLSYVERADSTPQENSPFGSNINAPLMRVEENLSADKKHGVVPLKHFEAPMVEGQNRQPGEFPFTPYHFFEFATGRIAHCFGEEFSFYDNGVAPRTPCGQLQLTTRVLSVDGVRGEFKEVSSCVAEYEVPLDAWYFEEGAHESTMPYSILMEISLQPNGFLSAYMGTTLMVKDRDIYFRNLDGSGELIRSIDLRGKTITNKSMLLSTSVFGTNIIQSFTFELSTDGEPFYKGTAAFGYFSADALANQLGLDNGEAKEPWHVINQCATQRLNLTNPASALFSVREASKPAYRLAGGQLNFIDTVEFATNGGEFGKGYIYAERHVNPEDWFFQFHFHEDPVMPGSLGVEAIIEAVQAYMVHHDLGANLDNPYFMQPLSTIVWKYRGQINPLNRKMSLDVHIKEIVSDSDRVTVIANANLSKDGLRIYEVKDVAVSLVAQ
ncbi:MAG: beta-ketoacyl synthase N-terminal-like domain-containing protein [Pseudomonadota bacterium]